MRQFTYSDAKSHKFWNIELQGNSFTVTYGRQGTAGQTQTKTFADDEKAKKEHDKLVKEKLGKGYVEAGSSTPAVSGSMREALEAALVANPEDLANHMAYADWLAEQGDPRGEFIQVQLALEDPNKSAKERKPLLKREQDLLEKHQRDWLGELAPHLLKESEGSQRQYRALACQFQFARGWLDSIQADNFDVALSRTLAHAPQMRLLRRLILGENAYEEAGEYEAGDDIPEDAQYHPQLYPLVRSPYLGNVRVFQLGEQVESDEYFSCHTDGEAAIGVVKLMPKLEELYLLAHNVDSSQLFNLKTLTKLRILQMYHNVSYPLPKLAKNPAFAELTHLLCHPHNMEEDAPYIRLPDLRAVVRSTALTKLTHLQMRLTDFGDKGCDEIVQSGILKRLKLLDLRGGTITDKGAATLADCADLRNLERLNLDRNCLTDAGIAALTATKVNFSALGQWQPTPGGDFSDNEYLFEGDIE